MPITAALALLLLPVHALPSSPPQVGAPVPMASAPSDWAPPAPGGDPSAPSPSDPDRAGFWERFQDKAFDQICKNIKLRVKRRLDIEGVGSSGIGVDRHLERSVEGTFALVDIAQLDLSAGYGVEVLGNEQGSVSLSLGSSLRGESLVVRPLGTRKSCDELGRLVNVLDFKTALPLSPDRIAAMQTGEIWKLPLTLHVGVGAGASAREFPVAVSFGYGKEGRSSVSLYRMSEDTLRLRLRIDKADLRSADGQLLYTLPGAMLGLPQAENIIVEQLVRLVDRTLAREISRYLNFRFSAGGGKRTGRQILIEFLLDPRDEETLTALRGLLRGDLNALRILGELAARAGRSLTGSVPAAEEASELAGRHSTELGRPAAFVGADDYERASRRISVKLPILADLEWASGKESDRVVILDDAGTRYDIHRADKRSDSGFFDLPLFGQMTKHNVQRSVQVATARDASGAVQEPVAVFLRQEGFLRSRAGLARDMALQADEISRLIGVRGEGVNSRTRLPVDELLPEESLYSPPQNHAQSQTELEKSYHRGLGSFSLAFGRKAVADILAAPADVILRSFANALAAPEREAMSRLLKVSRLEDGRLRYSDRDAMEALGDLYPTEESARSGLGWLSTMARGAAGLVSDLAAANAAASAEERGAAFLRILAGEGRSGLGYEDALKVLVQLVDPLDVFAEFNLSVEKRIEGEKDLQSRLLLNASMRDGGLVAEANLNRARFAEPSRLTD